MNNAIPTYQLSSLLTGEQPPTGVFFLGSQPDVRHAPIYHPYRSNYYKIGICLRGQAKLKVNLETYVLEPGCLLALSPYVVKQLVCLDENFDSCNIFFTRNFMAAGSSLSLNKFRFFDRDACPVLPLAAAPAAALAASFQLLQQKYDLAQAYRPEVLKHAIASLLYEVASIYEVKEAATRAGQSRSQYLTAEFKQLVMAACTTERGLAFYADKLCISPKHLTETVKEVTGKTASEWITEAVLLEAKVLLQNPALTVAQIADGLHFDDQSAFGRFFKNGVGLSPTAYRLSG